MFQKYVLLVFIYSKNIIKAITMSVLDVLSTSNLQDRNSSCSVTFLLLNVIFPVLAIFTKLITMYVWGNVNNQLCETSVFQMVTPVIKTYMQTLYVIKVLQEQINTRLQCISKCIVVLTTVL